MVTGLTLLAFLVSREILEELPVGLQDLFHAKTEAHWQRQKRIPSHWMRCKDCAADVVLKSYGACNGDEDCWVHAKDVQGNVEEQKMVKDGDDAKLTQDPRRCSGPDAEVQRQGDALECCAGLHECGECLAQAGR